MSKLDQQLQLIKKHVRELSKRQGQYGLRFGDIGHQYYLNPCLSEDEVIDFETQHQIRLPEGYRRFLLEIGNGGLGPDYGLLELGRFGYRDTLENPEFYSGYLSRPFPHTKAWNYHDVDQYEEADEEYINQMQGSLYISTRGCTMEVHLVVTGSEAGNLWMDDRGADYGITPLNVDFITWYISWLD